MKIQKEAGRDALISGGSQIHDVGISDDPHDQMMIMNILSNSLYSDKVAAVLREYGCNAADANVEAGRGKQPIEVRLPNKLDPTVAIRDFGAGMTPEQILQTFIKLGRSTKRNSNAFTGMLGIGSKAGFAYGDSFVVTSWTDGQKAVYNLFRDKGLLKMVPMFSGPSEEPEGVEVKVPVRVEHMQEFLDKAKLVFSYFRVRPIIHGAKIEWIPREELFSGAGWRFTGNQRSVAIMGNVAYKLDPTAMGYTQSQSYYGGQAASKEETLLNLGVELDFRIGDLEIAANREGLQYSDVTKASIMKVLGVITNEIGYIFTKKMAGAKTLWEAHSWYYQNFDQLGHNRYTLKKLVTAGAITWQGLPVNSGSMYIGNKEGLLDVSVTEFRRGGRRYNSAPGTFRTTPNAESIEASGAGVLFVINDLPKFTHSPSRLKALFLKDPNLKHIIQFTFKTASAKVNYWKNRHLAGLDTTLLSSVVPAVTLATPGSGGTVSVHNSKHSTKVFTLDEAKPRDWASVKSTFWLQASVDLKKDSGVYVPIDQFCIRGPGMGEIPYRFIPRVKLIREAGLLTAAQPIYGFKPDRVAKLGPNWVRLDAHILAELAALAKKSSFLQELADSLAAQAYVPLLPVKERTQFAAGTSIRKLLDEYHRMANPTVKKGLLTALYSGAAEPWLKKPTVPAPSFDLKAQQKQVLADYPLLTCIPLGTLNNPAPSQVKNVIDYTRLVESV